MTISPYATASQISAALVARTDTSHAICQQYLNRIAASSVRAFVSMHSNSSVLAAADASDARAAAGTRLSALDGVPFSLKVPHQTAGLTTSNGGTAVNYIPSADGDIAAKLLAAGAILLGKTQVGTSPIHGGPNVWPETLNPYNLAYPTGGSSSGAGAANAAGLTGFDVGIDGAGSVRIPASMCGIYGIKTTNGLISGYGDNSIGMASVPPMGNLDTYTYGPMARSLDDLELLLPFLAGPTRGRPAAPKLQPGTSPTLHKIKQVNTIGIWNLSPFIQTSLNALASSLSGSGVTVATGSAPWYDQDSFNNTVNALQTIPENVAATFPQNTTPWYAAQLNAPGTNTYVQQSECAAQGRAHIIWLRQLVADLFEDVGITRGPVDVLMLGTVALSPVAIGQTDPAIIAYMAFTQLFNITGNPAVTLPLGVDANGIPYGVQLVARHWEDMDLLHWAKQVNAFLPGYTQPPNY